MFRVLAALLAGFAWVALGVIVRASPDDAVETLKTLVIDYIGLFVIALLLSAVALRGSVPRWLASLYPGLATASKIDHRESGR